jgi:(p)ppGpp synthase/HD superfamily hydrolase
MGGPSPGSGPGGAGRGHGFRKALAWRPDPTGRRADVLRAAVLHDVVEDTACTLDEVRERFGDRVATLVDWVTKPPRREARSREEARAAYLDRLRSAPDDAVLVKLADRLSNVQRLDTHPRPEKRRDYYDETVRFILPLAERHPWFLDWYGAWRTEFRRLGEGT